MSTTNPTPDDLRTIAANLRAEGHTSRADTLDNAAYDMEHLAQESKDNKRIWEAVAVRLSRLERDLATGDYSKNLAELERLKVVEFLAKKFVFAADSWEAEKEYCKLKEALLQK